MECKRDPNFGKVLCKCGERWHTKRAKSCNACKAERMRSKNNAS